MLGVPVGLDRVTYKKNKRTEKGNSLLQFPEKYVVFDLETTGLDPNFDSIIEVAAIYVEHDEIVKTFESLINPHFELSWFITELTGITDEMLRDQPDIEDVLPKFLDFVGDNIVIGHNIACFDTNFIYDTMISLYDKGFSNDFVDTCRLSRKLFPEFEKHRLYDLVQQFGIGKGVEHRALSDVLQTFECYKYMKNYATQNAIDLSTNKKYCLNTSYENTKEQRADIDRLSPLYNSHFVFTGTLQRMSRAEAKSCVESYGGYFANNVSNKTNYLVLGSLEYASNLNGDKSTKIRDAEAKLAKGADIKIISENVFYDMLDDITAQEV